MADFSIKQGGRLPGIRCRLSAPGIQLASAVEFHMRQLVTSGTPAVKIGTGGIDDATALDKLTVHYDWGTLDTDTIGIFVGEWWLTIAGKLMKVPGDSYVIVEVLDDAA